MLFAYTVNINTLDLKQFPLKYAGMDEFWRVS